MAEKKIERTKQRVQIGSLLDQKIYRQMRALAALQGCRVGELIDQACKEFIKRQQDFQK